MPTPSFFERSKIKEIVILGSKFFWIQLTTLLLFQSNNLIIAHTCGNTSVAEYNIAYKYIGLIEMAFMIIMTPFGLLPLMLMRERIINGLKEY